MHFRQSHISSSAKMHLQWTCYVACTLHIFHSTRTLQECLLYVCCCLVFYILSSFNYPFFLWVNAFNFVLSLLWSWIVVGKIFCVSLKLLFKPWGWIFIAVMVQLYFNDFEYDDVIQLLVLCIFLVVGYAFFKLALLIFQTCSRLLIIGVLLCIFWYKTYNFDIIYLL